MASLRFSNPRCPAEAPRNAAVSASGRRSWIPSHLRTKSTLYVQPVPVKSTSSRRNGVGLTSNDVGVSDSLDRKDRHGDVLLDLVDSLLSVVQVGKGLVLFR